MAKKDAMIDEKEVVAGICLREMDSAREVVQHNVNTQLRRELRLEQIRHFRRHSISATFGGGLYYCEVGGRPLSGFRHLRLDELFSGLNEALEWAVGVADMHHVGLDGIELEPLQ